MIFLYDTLSLEIIFSLNTALCITRNGDTERDKSRPYAGAWRLIYICRGVISVFYKWHGVSRRDVIYHVSHL